MEGTTKQALKKIQTGAGKMAQQAKAFAFKPDILSLIHRTDMVEGNRLPQVFLCPPHICIYKYLPCTCVHEHTHTPRCKERI